MLQLKIVTLLSTMQIGFSSDYHKVNINLLKQDICGMPQSDQVAGNTSPMDNTYHTHHTFVQNSTDHDPYRYRKCGNL